MLQGREGKTTTTAATASRHDIHISHRGFSNVCDLITTKHIKDIFFSSGREENLL